MPAHEPEYLAEGKRRMHLRKLKRKEKYKALINEAMKLDLDLSQYRQYKRYGSWYEGGKYMQICSYKGHCEHPCNGDC